MKPIQKIRTLVLVRDVVVILTLLGITYWVYHLMSGAEPISELKPVFWSLVCLIGLFMLFFVFVHRYAFRILDSREKEKNIVEKKLSNYSARLKSIIETPYENIGIYSLDKQLRYTGFNSAHRQKMIELFGGEIVEGKSVWDVWPESLAGRLVKSYRRALNGEHFSLTREYGGRFYTQLFNPIYDGSEIIGLTSNIFDVTEKVKAEEELETYKNHLEEVVEERTSQLSRQTAFFQHIMDSLPNLIFVRDENHRYILVNKATANSFGCSKDDLIGKSIRETHHTLKEAKKFEKEDRHIFNTGEVFEVEADHQWPDGTRKWLFLSKRRMTVEEENYVLGVHFDITYLKETEHKLQKANRELKRTLKNLKSTQLRLVESEKMASLGQLTAGLAHEINNPINYVAGNVGPLREDIKEIKAHLQDSKIAKNPSKNESVEALFEEVESLLRGVEEGSLRVKNLMSDLYSFAMPESPQLVLYNINDAIKSTVNLVQHPLKDRIELQEDYGELPPITCSPQQVGQVFLNVINNAAQAIPEKGRISIKTRKKSSVIIIKISDTGVGIREEHIYKIFDPFFTTKDVGEGTGLGLSISYRIIKEHGGTIDVGSQYGNGSTFTIKLPVERGSSS